MKDSAKYCIIPLIVSEDDTQGFVELTQRDKRNFAKIDKNYEYSMT